MQRTRFAIIGTGEIAGCYMTHFARRTDNPPVEFAGAFDVMPDRAAAFAKKFGGKTYGSMDELLGDPGVQAIVNLTRAPMHAEISRRALEHGKHVLSEKPLAMNLPDATALVNLAQQKGLVLACAPFILLGDVQQKVKRIIRDKGIGDVLVVTADMYHGRLESWHGAAEAFYRDSGGPVLDVGPYVMTLLIDWLGPVSAVSGLCATLMPSRTDPKTGPFKITIADHAIAILRFECGAVARIDISNVNCNSGLHGIEMHGTEGSLRLPALMDFTGQLCVTHKSDSWEQVEGDPAPKPLSGVDWSTGIVELGRAIQEKRQPANSGRLALHVLQVLLALQEASRQKREIAIPAS